MISRALRTLAIAAPLTLAFAMPAAHALTRNEPLSVDALAVSSCDLNFFIMDLEGAKAGQPVTGSVTYKKANNATILNDVLAGQTSEGNAGQDGTATWHYSHGYPSKTAKVVINIHYTAWDGTPTTWSGENTFLRSDCPGAPVTGGNSAPIGKFALGATLAGGLLATVAIRRRPRKSNAAA